MAQDHIRSKYFQLELYLSVLFIWIQTVAVYHMIQDLIRNEYF